MVFSNSEWVEHFLDISHDSNRFSAKALENSNQAVCEVCSWHQYIVALLPGVADILECSGALPAVLSIVSPKTRIWFTVYCCAVSKTTTIFAYNGGVTITFEVLFGGTALETHTKIFQDFPSLLHGLQPKGSGLFRCMLWVGCRIQLGPSKTVLTGFPKVSVFLTFTLLRTLNVDVCFLKLLLTSELNPGSFFT